MLLLFGHSAMSDSLRPHGLQHARLPCLSQMGVQMYGHFGNQFGNLMSSSTYTYTYTQHSHSKVFSQVNKNLVHLNQHANVHSSFICFFFVF